MADASTSSAPDDIENAIRQNAQGPESAEVDGVKVKQHSPPDQIEADKYLPNKPAGGKPGARMPARKGRSRSSFARVIPITSSGPGNGQATLARRNVI